jgi:GDP-4-dehydro-6-deoxy-D-mannose reductase
MSPERILITGAEGFVGRHLCAALAAEVPGATLLGQAETRLDVTDREAVFAGIKAGRPQACVHLAGIAAIGDAAADPARAWAVNLHGAINVAEAILEYSPDCRMLFVSSAEVYGASFRAGRPLDETAPLSPMNLYAATKAAAEMALVALIPRGLDLVRLRPFNHTGPGQSEAFVIPAFAGQIARIEAGRQPPVMATGALTPERDFLDVRDVCAAYLAALTAMLPAGTVLNIASGRAVRISVVLDQLLALARCKVSAREDPARLRPVEIPRAVGDARLAAKLLNWRPCIPLATTLGDVLNAARQEI